MSIRLTHGGDWQGFLEEYGRKPLDYSANISPYGVPEGVKKAIIQACEGADCYPDPLCRSLVDALHIEEDCQPEWILCGNGAADLIFRLALTVKPKKALLLSPCFAEYEQALSTVDCSFEYYELKQEKLFRIEEDILNRITEEIDILFLCEPNNPTGQTTDPALLRRILERCRQMQVLLVVDECFNSFLDDPALHTMKPLLATYDNLVILKAFTKKYGIPGIRLGYLLCADQKLVEGLRHMGQPWAVSNLAQEAGLACLTEKAYWEKSYQVVLAERAPMIEALRALGLWVAPAEGNYILFYDSRSEAAGLLGTLDQRMRSRGILIRNCDNYRGLRPGWYRVAVRLPEQNKILIDVLTEVLAEGDRGLNDL